MTEPTHEQVADALDDAADLIERGGWWDGVSSSRTANGKRYCIVTALNEGQRLLTGCYAVARHLGIGLGSIPEWNDRHTEQEVLDALRGCAKAERRLADEATR